MNSEYKITLTPKSLDDADPKALGLAPLLADVCEGLYASKCAPCEELANWLIEREAKAAREACAAALNPVCQHG